MILRYESVNAFISSISPSTNVNRWRENGVQVKEWDDGVSGTQAMRLAVEGDPRVTAVYTKSLDDLETTIGTTDAKRYRSDILGSSVNVPAYLAGIPANMRRRIPRETSTRHVSVYMSQESYAGIVAETLLNRGMAVLGLLDTLVSNKIGVDLYLVCNLGGADEDCTQVIRVESRPLDLSTAGFAIAHPSFVRNLVYSRAAELSGFFGRFARSFTDRGYGSDQYASYNEYMRSYLGLEATDIWIPPAGPYDEMLTDTAKWIETHVNQIKGTQ